MEKIRVAVIGYGYWGPNIVRNLLKLKDVNVSVLEIDKKRRVEFRKNHPLLTLHNTIEEILTDITISAVIIATPPKSHFKLAKDVLLSRKHVLVEKPLTVKSSQTRTLIKVSEEQKRILMVGHTFVYSPAVTYLKKLISTKKLGSLYSYSSSRLNLGLFQRDVNVLWDLAVHDLSILDYLTGQFPKEITTFGTSHVTKKIIEDATLFLRYKSGMTAQIHVSWLSPLKVRIINVVGSNKMALYNDIETSEKIKIYDKSVKISKNSLNPFAPAYRQGDINVPYLDQTEALYHQLNHFVSCIRKRKKPISDGKAGLRVIEILENAEKSLLKKKTITLSS